MRNHGLGIHSDKTLADSSTKNILKYLTTSLTDLPNRTKHFGMFRKNTLIGYS